nr:MAG TPA: hypothetical protein [Caudoviricetes sp.]
MMSNNIINPNHINPKNPTPGISVYFFLLLFLDIFFRVII